MENACSLPASVAYDGKKILNLFDMVFFLHAAFELLEYTKNLDQVNLLICFFLCVSITAY